MISNSKYNLDVDSNDKVFYVYALLKTYNKGNFIYEDIKFEYEPFYIGKGYTYNKYNRLNASLYAGNKFKNNIINKHKKLNLNITVLMIKTKLNEIDAFNLEINMIKKIGKKIDNKGPLCNVTDGGDGRSGSQVEKYVPILQYDRNGFLIKEYKSINEARRLTNIHNISRSLDSESTAGTYIWKKRKEKIEKKIDVSFLSKKIHQGNLKRKVALIDDNGNILQEFNSIKEAMEKTSCHKSKIVAVCKNKIKSTKNKKFKYV